MRDAARPHPLRGKARGFAQARWPKLFPPGGSGAEKSARRSWTRSVTTSTTSRPQKASARPLAHRRSALIKPLNQPLLQRPLWKDDKSIPSVRLTVRRKTFPRFFRLTRPAAQGRPPPLFRALSQRPRARVKKPCCKWVWKKEAFSAPDLRLTDLHGKGRPLDPKKKSTRASTFIPAELPGPCAGPHQPRRINPQRIAERALLFFEGKERGACEKNGSGTMKAAARSLNFEKAAALRNNHRGRLSHCGNVFTVRALRRG